MNKTIVSPCGFLKRLGAFWERLGAAIIDGAIVFALSNILYVLILNFINLQLFYRGGLLLEITYLLYHGFFLSSNLMATPGKMLANIKVIHTNGKKLSAKQSLQRALLSLISLLLMGIGHLLCLFHKQNQAVHDTFTETYVVSTDQPRRSFIFFIFLAIVSPILVIFAF